MSKKFSDYLTENMESISNIMDNIEKVLSDNKIDYKTNTSKTEIVIKDSNKEEITKLILSLPISSILLYMIIEFSEVKGKVYIRKKLK